MTDTLHTKSQLKKARKDRGWTQAHLASLLQVDVQTVRSWESGKRAPFPENRRRLFDVFGMSSKELGLEDQPPGEKVSSVSPTHTETSPPASRPTAALDLSQAPIHTRRSDINRRRMLQRVRSVWIAGVLKQALDTGSGTLLTLNLECRPDALMNPWSRSVQETNLPPEHLPIGTSITQAFDAAGAELLLLGEPGAGKTTLLLTLAHDLLDRAEQDENHPIPVVLNLSSWAEKRLPLTTWLVEELNTKYQVPRSLGETWMNDNDLLLLLDGLDEMADVHRAQCIAAVNTYRQERGMVPVVVCSRSADYFAQDARLLLGTAVLLHPLTPQQIDSYLKDAGAEFASVRLALKYDTTLREMCSTPLMLNTLAVAYQGMPTNEFLAVETPHMRRNMVFRRYVERVLEGRGSKKAYTVEQINRFLGWLAYNMHERNQTEFYIERLQPDQLDEVKKRQYQKAVIRLITIVQCILFGGFASWLKGGLKDGVVGSGNGILGLFSTLPGNTMMGWMSPGIGAGNQGGASMIIIMGIVVWLVATLIASQNLPTLTPKAIWYGLRNGIKTGFILGLFTIGVTIPFFTLIGGLDYGLQYGMGIGFFLGMCTGTLHGLVSGLRYGQQTTQEKASFRSRCIDGLVFGAGGFIGFVFVGLLLQVSIRSTFIYGGVAGLFFFLAYGFGGGSRLFPSLGQNIKPAEMVTWSWGKMFRDMASNGRKSTLVALVTTISVSVAIGAVTSFFFLDVGYGLRYGLIFGIISGLIVGIAGMLANTLKSGWSSVTLPKNQRMIPNEGIARSGRNALLGACIFAPIGGIASGLACGIGFGLVGGLSTWWIMGSAFALMLCIIFFVIFAIAHGGIAWIEHFLLRWYLWRAGCIPANYVHFLDATAKYALMRKVGGGYIFIHRLVLEYFMRIHQPELPDSLHRHHEEIS